MASQKLPTAHGSAPQRHPTGDVALAVTTVGVAGHGTLLAPEHTPPLLHVAPTGHSPVAFAPHGHAAATVPPPAHGAWHVALASHQWPGPHVPGPAAVGLHGHPVELAGTSAARGHPAVHVLVAASHHPGTAAEPQKFFVVVWVGAPGLPHWHDDDDMPVAHGGMQVPPM